ncbi:MAG: type VI secretion system lipoprotein TssJ [Rhodothermales bacterium]
MPLRSLSHRVLHVLLFAGVFAVFSGCRSSAPPPPPPPEPPLTVTVVGGSDLNGGGNAAVLRIYQLAGDANFQRAPVQAFWQSDEQVLGSELLGAKREVLLFPESTEIVRIVLDEKTQFLAIAADLRDPDPDHWREIYPVSDVRGKAMAVVVGENRLFVRVE